MSNTCWAVYTRQDGERAEVLYSHLTEETADEVTDRMNDNLNARGIAACVWNEPHHPSAVFVISRKQQIAAAVITNDNRGWPASRGHNTDHNGWEY